MTTTETTTPAPAMPAPSVAYVTALWHQYVADAREEGAGYDRDDFLTWLTALGYPAVTVATARETADQYDPEHASA